MSQTQLFRAFIHNRLSVAFEEIFEMYEKIITAYEDEVPCSKAASEHKRRQLAAMLRREALDTKLKRVELKRQLDAMLRWDEFNRTDPLQVMASEMEKNEEEEHQEKELALLGSEEEEDIPEFTLLPVAKREDAVEEPLASDFHQYQILENGKTVPLLSTSSPGCTLPPLLEIEGNGDNHRVSSEPENHLDSACRVEPFIPSPSSETKDMVFGLTLEETSDCDMQTFCDGIEFMAPLGLCNGLKPVPPSQTPTPYQCKVCGQFLRNKMSLVQHVKAHPCECGLCGKHLEPTDSIKLHLQTHKQCNVCGKTFSTYSVCDRHMMALHSRERPFACTDCGKGYTTMYLLHRHQLSHTKPICCPFCGKRFGQKTSMEIHMRAHTGEKPYGCGVCGKQFAESGRLTKHLRLHSGEKPYGCTVCEKQFGQNGHLKEHMKIHS